MNDKINGVSSEAVEKATGKGWGEWIKILQSSPVANQPHKEIARWLAEDQKVQPWWCQMITVGYEYATGRRTAGETADQGFEVGVHKTINVPAAAAWDFLLSAQGLKLWLGDINNLKLGKKAPYQTKEGTIGEVRTFKESEFIRLTWQPKSRKSLTTLQVRTQAAGSSKTRLSFHHEKLANSREREKMREHWQKVVARIAEKIS